MPRQRHVLTKYFVNHKMKLILQTFLILIALPCFAQSTGHQKIFLEIADNGYTLDFKSCFKKNKQVQKTSLGFRSYQLFDISKNPTGFEFYSRDEYIHKTLMTDNHHIQIVKNKNDTMSIEIMRAFNVYFLSIPFQRGYFRLCVNDGNINKWSINSLPNKLMKTQSLVYNITPIDWKAIEVKTSMS